MKLPTVRRLVLWTALLVVGVCAARAVGPRLPRDELRVLVELALADDCRVQHYASDTAVVGFHRGCGWTFTVYAGNDERCEPAQFVVLTNLAGRRGATLLLAPDPEGAIREVAVPEAGLADFLDRTGLDPSALDVLLATRYGARR